MLRISPLLQPKYTSRLEYPGRGPSVLEPSIVGAALKICKGLIIRRRLRRLDMARLGFRDLSELIELRELSNSRAAKARWLPDPGTPTEGGRRTAEGGWSDSAVGLPTRLH